MSSCSEPAPARRAARRLGLVALLAAALAAPRPALALNVHALYRAACDRVLGVILGVDKRAVHLIDLAGREVVVPRHEIVSLAYYPVSGLPVGEIHTAGRFRPLRVDTLVGGALVELVEGWPIDYSEQKVAFLQRDGKELVINRDSIWRLTFVEAPPGPGPDRASAAPRDLYMHPQASGFCEEGGPAAGQRRYFPQQFLNDEVVIKRELDRLREGYEQILEYEVDQRFYPVPQLYQNRTSLGLWLPAGSRHGASSGRTNLAPLVIDELSLGPFRYQHVFITGAAPNHFLLHEEPQTQIYYRFKAAYFHASVMFDPSLVLVGRQYGWRERDFRGRRADDRLVEYLALELGFDLGPLSLQFFPAVASQAALWVDGAVLERQNNLLRGGPRVTLRDVEAELLVGLSGDDTGAYRFARGNLTWQLGQLRVGGSAIWRRTDFSDDPAASGYRASTWTGALRAGTRLRRRFGVEGFASIERHHARWAAGSASQLRLYPKLGLSATFSF